MPNLKVNCYIKVVNNKYKSHDLLSIRGSSIRKSCDPFDKGSILSDDSSNFFSKRTFMAQAKV